MRDDLHHLLAHLLQADAEAFQDAGRDPFAFTHQPEEQVLGADVVIIQPPRLVHRQLDDFLRARRQPRIADDHRRRPGR